MALGWRDQYSRYRGYFLNIVNLYKQRADLRAFVEVILSIATITIFLLFALKPTALTIIALTKEINEKKDTVARLDQKISDLTQASSAFAKSQNLLPALDTAVSISPQPDIFAKQIQGVAAKDSVKVAGLSVGDVILSGKIPVSKNTSGAKPFPGNAHEMNISINLQGDYPGLTSFMKDLENLRIVTKIDQIGINSSNIEGQSIIVALISGRVPYLGNETQSQ